MELKTEREPTANAGLPFEIRAASALGISVIADALDYVGAPIFSLPLVGDIADGIIMAILYRLTGSKKSAAINAIEFIPFIGDFVPTYTITTLIWIRKELRKRREDQRQKMLSSSHADNENAGNAIESPHHDRNPVSDDQGQDLSKRLTRAYAALRS